MVAKKTNRGGRAKPQGPDLSDRLSGLELDARRTQRLQTAETTRTGRTPLHVLEVAEKAAAVMESAVEDAQRLDPPPELACREGCDWCCYWRVGTAVPEVLRIAAYLRRTLTEDELRTVRERVARLAELRRELKPGKRADPRLPCALLVEHRCTVYPVRPLTCRGANSEDAGACEEFVQTPGQVFVPSYEMQLRLATFVLDGMRAGLSEARLSGDLLELTAALHIALEMLDAAERWLGGEPVFAPARLN